MKKIAIITLLAVFLTGCENTHSEDTTFKEAHDSHETVLTEQWTEDYETPIPPEGVGLELVQYDSDVGPLDAYVSVDPNDNQQHPMVIWVVGGWGNSIDEFAWTYGEWDNDQTGQFFSEAGILMMYPSFRGGNENPGYEETLYGEIDDIFSALEYAKTLPYVDPDQIYLAGHSTGGTRVLLASEYDEGFRAVFSFGPVDDISKHNQTQFTFDLNDKEEAKLRSPKYWMQDVKTPTFVIEGEDGNSDSVLDMMNHTDNENLNFYVIDNEDHFSYLAPVTMLIADKILADDEVECNIEITDKELKDAVNRDPVMRYPALTTKTVFDGKLSADVPAYWYEDTEDYDGFIYYEMVAEDDDSYTFWNTAYVDLYSEEYTTDTIDEEYDSFIEYLEDEYGVEEKNTSGATGYVVHDYDEEEGYYSDVFITRDKDSIYYVTVGYYEDFYDDAQPFVKEVFDSVKLNK